ncbi:MAG: caspase family protein [Planctomycetota bacterium]
MPESPELLFDRFRALETVVDTSLERVLRCWHTRLDKEVMLEWIGDGLAEIPTADGRRRAMREARLLSELDHPGLPRILDVLEDERGPVLVLDGYGGETLEARLDRSGPLTSEEVRRLALELSSALAALHRLPAVHRGIAERDVVLRRDGSALLRGLRFAKLLRGQVAHSSIEPRRRANACAKELLPSHPAPEQRSGLASSPTSDLFALGCVLYAAASGEPPFADDASGPWRAPEPIKRGAPDLDSDVARVIDDCLARSPHRRPTSAAAIGETLMEREVRRTARRRRFRGAAVGALLAAVLAVVLVAINRGSTANAGADPGVRGVGQLSASTVEYSPGYDASHALLIGISDYEHFGAVSNARSDVLAIRDRLRALPTAWDVTVLDPESTDRDGIFDALDVFVAKLDRNDQGFLYYAGHGEENSPGSDLGWILPRDAERGGGRSTWIPFERLEMLFDRQRSAKHVLVALDCCHSGLLSASRGGQQQRFAMEVMTTRPAYVVISSGLASEDVSDGPAGGNSPFARAFLGTFDDSTAAGEPVLTARSLFAAIQDDFARNDVRDQRPTFGAGPLNSGGEFVFFLTE